jgi:hypothetical protein
VRRVLIVAAGVGLLVLLGLGAWQVLRPPVRAAAGADPDVTVVCAAASGLEQAACAAWGDEILAAGPPSTTFEMEDLERLELSRSLLGLGDCQVAYFLGRYPDDAAWTEATDCPGGR